MKLFKFLWSTHKWTGIVLAVVFLNIALTGFLLLWKKDYTWIQPSTHVGAPGDISQFITTERLFEVVLKSGHADFQRPEDIDRVDFRPGKRVHKVRSRHNHSEIQVDAVTGVILGTATRRSDWIEQLHDGSWFGDWVHDLLMPLTAVALGFLVVSGLYMWAFPLLKKRRRRQQESRS